MVNCKQFSQAVMQKMHKEERLERRLWLNELGTDTLQGKRSVMLQGMGLETGVNINH